MEAIIRTNNRNLFNSLLLFLKSLHITVETNEKKVIKKKSATSSRKQFNPCEYEGILSHLNLDIDSELQNMRNAWKKRNF